MFCPKCGTKNPDNGKFCRKCGTDLGNVSDAISGKLSNRKSLKKHKKTKSGWESAMSNLFMGIAFITVAVILGITGKGSGWWFWMFIPALGMIGAGVSKIIAIKQAEKANVSTDITDDVKQININQKTALPPKQTEFVSNIPDSKYETGDLVPPSVVENSTRHLEMDKEGETMTLPKDKI